MAIKDRKIVKANVGIKDKEFTATEGVKGKLKRVTGISAMPTIPCPPPSGRNFQKGITKK